jgi:hypothetical protein
MTPREREQKILLATRDELLTRAEIFRLVGGGQRQLGQALDAMVSSGQLVKGEDIILPNNVRTPTYKAAAGALPEERPAEERFHGRAPSVFEWRGNFGLRS